MSSGVQDTPDDLRNCPQSAGEDLDLEDLSVTPSSILYLLQEATKLTSPSSQFSLGGEGLCPKEKSISMSITCSPKAQKENAQPSFTRTFSVLKSIQTSSPWEVMSLINLQCEQLLHCGQIRGEEGDFYTCTSKTDDAEHTDVMDSSSAGLNEGPSTVFSGEDEREAKSDVCWSVPHVIDATDQMLSNQSADEDCDRAKTEAIEDLAELISRSTAEISYFSREESSENYFLGEAALVEAELVDVCAPPCHMQEAEVADDLSRPVSLQTPNVLSSVDFTSSLVDEKDGNSGLWFAFSECDNPESQAAVMSKTTPQSGTDLNNNLELQGHEEASSAQSSWGNRRRTPRKQAHPARSPDLQDPELQGVTFSMQTEIDHSTDQCRLLITSNYRQAVLPFHSDVRRFRDSVMKFSKALLNERRLHTHFLMRLNNILFSRGSPVSNPSHQVSDL